MVKNQLTAQEAREISKKSDEVERILEGIFESIKEEAYKGKNSFVAIKFAVHAFEKIKQVRLYLREIGYSVHIFPGDILDDGTQLLTIAW